MKHVTRDPDIIKVAARVELEFVVAVSILALVSLVEVLGHRTWHIVNALKHKLRLLRAASGLISLINLNYRLGHLYQFHVHNQVCNVPFAVVIVLINDELTGQPPAGLQLMDKRADLVIGRKLSLFELPFQLLHLQVNRLSHFAF